MAAIGEAIVYSAIRGNLHRKNADLQGSAWAIFCFRIVTAL